MPELDTRPVFGILAAIALGCSPKDRPARAADTREPAPAQSTQEAAPPPTSAADGGVAGGAARSDDIDDMLAELEEDEGGGIREIPRCLSLRGESACTGVGKVMLVCTGLGNILTSEPTERLLGCLESKNGTRALCETDVLENCALSAIDRTAPSSDSTASCRRMVDQCNVEPKYEKYFTLERCSAGLTALRKAPRDDFVDCMDRRCDLRLCASGLL